MQSISIQFQEPVSQSTGILHCGRSLELYLSGKIFSPSGYYPPPSYRSKAVSSSLPGTVLFFFAVQEGSLSGHFREMSTGIGNSSSGRDASMDFLQSNTKNWRHHVDA